MTKRSAAREVAVKLIFEYLFNNRVNEDLLTELSQENELEKEQDFAAKTYYGVINNIDKLSAIIEEHSIGFSANRIFKVDKAIMLVALYEILFDETIDYKVSVNEALNIAKKYSTEKSYKFINGILSKVEKLNGNN